MRTRTLRVTGISLLIAGLGVSLFGYLDPQISYCVPCPVGRTCPPCPAPEIPAFAYLGLVSMIVGAALVLVSMFGRSRVISRPSIKD